MTLRRWAPARLAAFAALLLSGCGGSGGSSSSPPSVAITGVSWYEENIDQSFRQTPPPGGQTAFYDFWIHYSGDFTFADLQYARVYLPDQRYWLISGDPAFFDAANHHIGGWGRWFDDQNVNLLPIGSLKVEVKLTDGATATATPTIPAPASTTAGSFTTMHSQDLLSPPSTSAPMVSRAVVGSPGTLTSATQTISLSFSVNDTEVYDGWVWFYDAAKVWLGSSVLFRNPSTGLFASQLAGSTLHTDRTTNTLTLQAGDVQLASGATFGQIAQFHVVLTDGAQYTQGASFLRFDCRSVSALGSLTVQ